jgi:hypothetical protein
MRFVALWARHKLLGLECQVAAPAIAPALLNLSLRKSTHWENSFRINRFASVGEADEPHYMNCARRSSRAEAHYNRCAPSVKAARGPLASEPTDDKYP